MSEIFNFEKSPLEELRDLLPGTDGFDFGTSPHGLSAGLPLPVQETPEASSLSLHAKPLLPFGETQPPAVELPSPVSGTSDAVPLLTFAAATPRAQQGAYGREVGFKRKKPEAYTSPEVRSACRCIREAAAKQARESGHYLRLTDREYLHVYAAVEHDRNRTRKAIGKGLGEIGDLRATDSIWRILQAVMVRRMKGYRL